MAKRGRAGFTVCSTAFVALGHSQAKALGFAELPILVVPHPFGGRTRAEIDAIAADCAEQLVKHLGAQAMHGGGAAAGSANAERALATPPATTIEVDDDFDAINRLYRDRRWGDGLPVVPPTVDRVERMVSHAGRARDAVVARLAPDFGAATVERIAINAVLAGCDPQAMPVLVAVAEALASPGFNLQAVQTTTNPVAVWVVVNGPIARELAFNAEGNCLGEGVWTNATVGRAVRLMLRNIGGALPGAFDAVQQGQPGRYSFCCAENEARSPWAPLHVEQGFDPADSTVTVVAAEGTMNMNTHTKDAGDLLQAIAGTMKHPPSNEYHHGGEPWLILGLEHAEILHCAGYAKDDVKRRLWELSAMSASALTSRDFERTRSLRREELGEIDAQTRLTISPRPADIKIIVAGGIGTHSTYVPSFGISLAATRLIQRVR